MFFEYSTCSIDILCPTFQILNEIAHSLYQPIISKEKKRKGEYMITEIQNPYKIFSSHR